MLPAIQIDLPTARVQDAEGIAVAVAACRYQLKDAEVRVWQKEGLRITEQAYDMRLRYVSYIEIVVTADEAEVPISCPFSDLYWLYVREGQLDIVPPTNGRHRIKTKAGAYRISYLPAGKYMCHLKKGVHRLFYIVHNTDLLFREDTAELAESLAPIAAVRAQLPRQASTESISQTDGSFGLIFEFLKNPQQDYLRRAVQIKIMAYELIFKAHESLQYMAAQKRSMADWAEEMQVFITKCIAEGDPIDMQLISEKYRLSESYVRKIFRLTVRKNVGQYIGDQKMEHSRELLKNGYSVTQTARFLDFGYFHFTKKFKRKYGISPSTYQSAVRPDMP